MHPCGENQGMSLPGKSAISTEHAPAAIGPYSQAVEIGEMIYTSGQVPLDPTTGQMVEGGIREQTVRVLENLKAVLAAARQRPATRRQDHRFSQEHERFCGDE